MSNDTSLRPVRAKDEAVDVRGTNFARDEDPPQRRFSLRGAARRAKRRNSVSLIRYIMEGVRKRGRVMVFEIAKQSVGGTGKAIRTWAIAGYYGDVRDVSSIILIAKITGASTARPTNVPSPPYQATPPRYPPRRYNFLNKQHARFHVRPNHLVPDSSLTRPVGETCAQTIPPTRLLSARYLLPSVASRRIRASFSYRIQNIVFYRGRQFSSNNVRFHSSRENFSLREKESLTYATGSAFFRSQTDNNC